MSTPHAPHPTSDDESDSDETLLLAETLKQSRLAAGLPATSGDDDEETLKRALEASMKEGYSPEVLEKMMQEDIQKALEESRKDKAYQERFRYRALAAGLRQNKKDGGGPAAAAAAGSSASAPAGKGKASTDVVENDEDEEDEEEEEEEEEEELSEDDEHPRGNKGAEDSDDEDDIANSGDEDENRIPRRV